MLGHRSPVMTLEKYKCYVPHLTRADEKALLQMGSRAANLVPCLQTCQPTH